MRHPCILPFLLLALLASPIAADNAQRTSPQGAIYIRPGTFLEAAAPRQLTLNAHVSEFAYQPRGLEIAYTSTQNDGGSVTVSIKLVGVQHGAALATLAEDASTPSLAGWSADGRFLLIHKFQSAGGQCPDSYVCADLGANPIRTMSVNVPQDTATVLITADWSPSRTRILFSQGVRADDGHITWKLFAYNPAHGQIVPLASPLRGLGWIDDTHILLFDTGNHVPHFYSLNAATGQQTPLTKRRPCTII